MAARVGIGKDSVARIWADHELKPWKVDTFKVSTDPQFEEKLVDVVGLHLNSPARAAVFAFDEKTQCRALDRTQPSLPMKRGRAGTMTHDYKRHGPIDLFAAVMLGLPRRHHLGTGRADPGSQDHRRSALGELGPRSPPRARAAVRRLRGPVHLHDVHRLLQTAAARFRPAGVPRRRRPPTHRSRVQEFVAATDGRLRLFLLPGYSLELNPDEWVWKNVKGDLIGRAGVSGADDLKAKALSALHRLQKLPHLIRGFFHDPALRYITP